VLARLPGARRIWAIGAIHGAAQQLAQLHDRIGECFRDGDRLVYLGNYLGHDTAVRATIDELLDFRRRVLARRGSFACDIVFLRGAQEEMVQKLLQLQFAPNPGEVLNWMVKAGVEATIRAYGGDLRQATAATRDGAQTITRWTSALRGAINAAPGHWQLLSTLRHAALTEQAVCCLSQPRSIRRSRWLRRATRSGGATTTSSSSAHNSTGSNAPSGASIAGNRGSSNANLPYRSTVAPIAAALCSASVLRSMALSSTEPRPESAIVVP
jgi:hypothetical protein